MVLHKLFQKHHAVALNFPEFGCHVSQEPLNGKIWFQALIVEQLKSYPMVVESWESDEANLDAPLFRALANSMHKTIHHGAHGCLRVMGLEQKVQDLLYLLVLVWSPKVKYDLDRTGMKK